MNDLYEVLGIGKTATPAMIKSAYKILAQKWHPDKYTTATDKKKADKIFKEIANAYEVLSDTERRARYDETGSTKKGLDLEKLALDGIKTILRDQIMMMSFKPMDYLPECKKVLLISLKNSQESTKETNKKIERVKYLIENTEGDLLNDFFENEILNLQGQLEILTNSDAVTNKALDIIETLDFNYTGEVSDVKPWDYDNTPTVQISFVSPDNPDL